MRKLTATLLTMLSLSAGASQSEPTDPILAFLASKGLANAQVEIKDTSPIDGYKEVVIDRQKVLYFTPDASKLIDGQVVDLKTGTNYTQKTMQQIAASISFDPKQLKDNNVIRYGNSSKSVYLFVDPECPACQALEKQLFNNQGQLLIQDTSLVIVPVALRSHPASMAIIQNVLCDANPAKAWNKVITDAAYRKKVSETKPTNNCQATPADNMAIFDQSKMLGTPSLFDQEGKAITDIGALLPKQF
jgi:thiol:disulfide interchange protein DsbC